MTYRAHLTWAPDDAPLAHLRARLGAAVEISIGDDVPPETQALVAGRPKPEQLAAPTALDLLLIPFAGLPTITAERMRDFPHIPIHNIHHNAAPTAELAIGLMIACARLMIPAHNTFATGDWSPRFDGLRTALLLTGKTALVLGYGEVGRRIGAACSALGMEVLGVRRRPSDAANEFTLDELPGLLPRADVLFICLPGTPATDGLLGTNELAALPPRAVLVNVGRAAVVDEAALYAALTEGTMHAAGLDVWYDYPPDEASRAHYYPASHPFWELENVVLSPHRGGGLGNIRVEQARMDGVADALLAAARSEPVPHPVDLDAGY
jgi:phosphoglycerate dehydrogenase-like enzyme